jgi:cell division protein FtsI (penicillin-binding protein 3)
MGDYVKPFKINRLIVPIAIFAVWALLIAARLIHYQIFLHKELSAGNRNIITENIPAPRGTIFDSQKAELATSVMVKNIIAEPRNIPNVFLAAEQLSPLLDIDLYRLIHRMTNPDRSRYLVVKRKIPPSLAERIKALNIEGIRFEDDSLRVYPYRNLLSQTLGFINMAGRGVAGLEMQYDNELKGTPGKIRYEVDAVRRPYNQALISTPLPGNSLLLSIDRSIQHITQRELSDGVKQSRALAGTAIVMESETGRILALANYPDFNCNQYGKYRQELWRNRALQDQYEPGSTLKVVVASAALDAGLVEFNEIIDCQMGSILVGLHRFRDHKPYGLLTFLEILEFSSNVGAIKLGIRLGEERLYDALRAFGFGSKTEVDLPAEAAGLLRETNDWSTLSIASISFGQEIAVTSMQILTAINAVANGGYRVCPSIVDRVIGGKGNSIRTRTTERARIMSPATAAVMRRALEGAVLHGTGQRAALEGYRVAGKTGTAQKAVDGHFSKTSYIASFVGFAPLPDPKITILVQIDEPKEAIYGGDVAAPIFRKIAQQTLLKFGTPLDKAPLFDAGPAIGLTASNRLRALIE